MSDPFAARVLWRVGHVSDPLGFVPWERVMWSHRFDDSQRRFRTVYCAVLPETCLREVLADLRPDASEIQAYIAEFGPAAAADIPAKPVTARWRSDNLLVPASMTLAGAIVDLTDAEQRYELERRHAALLASYGLAHLDMHEITTPRRAVTQAIATDVYDRLDAAAVRFASRLDGNPCFAIFEHRGHLESAGQPQALTDPAPQALQNVAAGWKLALAPAPAHVTRKTT